MVGLTLSSAFKILVSVALLSLLTIMTGPLLARFVSKAGGGVVSSFMSSHINGMSWWKMMEVLAPSDHPRGGRLSDEILRPGKAGQVLGVHPFPSTFSSSYLTLRIHDLLTSSVTLLILLIVVDPRVTSAFCASPFSFIYS